MQTAHTLTKVLSSIYNTHCFEGKKETLYMEYKTNQTFYKNKSKKNYVCNSKQKNFMSSLSCRVLKWNFNKELHTAVKAKREIESEMNVL